ncbi:MAG: DUF4838 domain-containing protein [Armatimonadota bacterium]|nr:DUF4838 domain-containing protein [Armatimonadota bacterium]
MRPMIVCLVALLAALPCAAQVDLIRDGVARAQIVLSADAHEKVLLAAEELNLYLGKMAGARLPVNEEPADGPYPVYLGAPDAQWREEAELRALTFDGFVVECTGERLVLAGNVPEGTLNAVYWLLEELGVRWFIPTELGENVPEMATVTIPEMHRRVEPRFPCRRNHGIDRSIRGEGEKWRRRIRITSHDLNVPFNRYSHNLSRIVRISEHADEHPEYFPLINGKRRIPARGHGWQPCTTNPEVVALAVEAAHRWWDQHPYANYFSVGMNDGRGWCECQKCTALDVPAHTFRGRDVKSERYFTFVREVAEAVRETHPDRYISCIAYSSVEPVPRGVDLPDNVLVVITQDVGAWQDPEYAQRDRELARAWTEAAGALGVYNYTSQMWLLPRFYPHMMAEALRFYDEIGAVAITNESWPTWWYCGPMMYLRAKLMWDPQQDPDAVLDKYYSGFFGPAREPMKRLYERFEECMMTEREGRWFYGISSVPEQIALWTPERLEASIADLEEARRLADAEPYDARVQFVAEGFALAEAILREYWQAERVREMASTGGVDTSALLDELERLVRLTARREAIFDEVMQDELLSGIYHRLVEERGGRLNSWKGDINSAFGRALATLYSRGGEELGERLQRIAAEADESVAGQFRALAWIIDNPGAPNLCPNPGFEETEGDAPEGVDWVTANAPPGWSKWSIESRTDRITWEQEGGRTEPRCGRISGARLSTFIASIPVQPGERYYTCIWVRSTGSDQQSPRLAIKWQAAEGGWVRADSAVTVSGEGGAGRWQLLGVVVEVPEGAGRLIMLPRAADQQEGDVVLFDDARVIRLPDDL